MNPFLIEQNRIELLSLLPSVFGRTKFRILFDYYLLLFNSNSQEIISAYSIEFIDEFILELKKISSFYHPPEKTEYVIRLLERMISAPCLLSYRNILEDQSSRIKKELIELENILVGNNCPVSQKLHYPLIESFGLINSDDTFGILETVRVRISRSKEKNSFVFIPSHSKIDEELQKQTEISFNLALEFLRNKNKLVDNYHEVLIYFENRSAFYSGNSLGIILTIGFIEVLTDFYNLPFLLKINRNIASTGGLNEQGLVTGVSGDIIQKKLETVFFSPSELFVIPKQDELAASVKLEELKSKYPNRNLKLVFVDSLNDLLDRRSLIEIKKQSPLARSVKTIKRNRNVLILFSVILLLSSYFYLKDFDDNPAIIETQGEQLVFKNIGGKVLWGKMISQYLPRSINLGELNQIVRLLDINGDNKNEVLLCSEKLNARDDRINHGALFCYNHEGIKLWSYKFNDSVKTETESFKYNFSVRIIDTLSESGRKSLLLFANYEMLYPSVLFKLDLLSGKRLPGELWNPGAIYSAIIGRNAPHGKEEIVVGCANNALKLPCIFSVGIDNLSGTNYSTPEYYFIGKNPSKLSNCLFLPKTDYSVYKKQYINLFTSGSLKDQVNENLYTFNIKEGDINEESVLIYKLNYDFNDIQIIVNSNLRVRRDSLVAGGILKYPFTDTKEYTELLKSSILSWDGKNIKNKFR